MWLGHLEAAPTTTGRLDTPNCATINSPTIKTIENSDTMHIFAPLLTLVALAVAIPEGLIIENQTPDVTCTRKSRSGDHVDVHYRGTLASDGTEFDASYNRGTPLSFVVGTGRVIKG